MLVKCIGKETLDLPTHYAAIFAPEGCKNRKWSLIVGKTYVACAVNVFAGRLCYLVRSEDVPFPEFIPAPLFQVIDGRISTVWRYWTVGTFYENNLECVLGYPELADGSKHYDDLIDGKAIALTVFEKRLTEIHRELLCDHE